MLRIKKNRRRYMKQRVEEKKSIVTLLLDKGASVDSRNADGDTPLHLASRSDSQDTILLLLQKYADINAKNFNGNTPLFYADSIPTIQLLIQRGARVNELNKDGLGRLHFAVMAGKTSIVQCLVDSGQADINLQSPGEPTPLHLAVCFRHESLVRLFLAAGADRNRLWGGCTPLEYAKRDGLSLFIQLLQ
jgi:ankyrin repeat protein